jgi:hypothetical protein
MAAPKQSLDSTRHPYGQTMPLPFASHAAAQSICPPDGASDSNGAKKLRHSSGSEAEAVAFVVCSGIGLETGSAAQDYVVPVVM